ncbi:MAG TPA: hypothetical protein VGL55_00680 [Steroidobacteraceae bacterium]
MSRSATAVVSAFALALPLSLVAKPIAFAGGSTIMAEYGAGTMEELQYFYAPPATTSHAAQVIYGSTAMRPPRPVISLMRD